MLALALLSLPTQAQAGPVEDAAFAIEGWAIHFNAGNVDKLVSAYAPDATIHLTTLPNLLTGSDAIRASFAGAARARAQVKMGWNVGATAVTPDTVVLAGYYEFAETRSGQPHTTPARYTFVLTKRDGRWLIAHHHSSVRHGTAPPRQPSAPLLGAP